MPIEGIIHGLREAAQRHPLDVELADFVEDAVEALTEVDADLDKAYNEGKLAEAEELLVSLYGRRR